ncbi:hypothetical protein QEN19_003504 [Hanseniaspora menglaensis]
MNFSRQFLQQAKPAGSITKQTHYNILGKQKDICQAVLKPCVPIYVKRDNLILLQANNSLNTDSSNDVSLSTKWLFPFASFKHNPLRFLFDPPIYHRLVTNSTHKTTSLIGSNNGTTLCHVNLNGTNDWYLKPSVSNRIVSMEETSTLHINPSVKIKKVGMKFIKVDGRGSLVIQNDAASSGGSNGGIYSIVLETNENCIIKRDNLLGISGDSFLELSENLANFEFKETAAVKKSSGRADTIKPTIFNRIFSALKPKKNVEQTVNVKDYKQAGVLLVEENVSTDVLAKNKDIPDFSIGLFFKMTYNGLKSVYAKIHYILYQVSTGNFRLELANALSILDRSNSKSPFSKLFQNKFIKVSGPRTLLVQSNPSNYIPNQSKKKETDTFSVRENNENMDLTKILNFNNTGYNDTVENIKTLQKLNETKYENMKYLSEAYVDVKNGKVLFKSVDKF